MPLFTFEIQLPSIGPEISIQVGPPRSLDGNLFSLHSQSSILAPCDIKVIGRDDPTVADRDAVVKQQFHLGPEFEEETHVVQSNQDVGPGLFTDPLLTSILAESAGTEQHICQSCASIPVAALLGSAGRQQPLAANIGQLKESATSCALCATFLTSLGPDLDDDSCEVKLSVDGAESLFVWVGERKYTCPLRLFKNPGSKPISNGRGMEVSIPVELPFPVERGGAVELKIIREWLAYCETQHSCAAGLNGDQPELPTRVIDVGLTESDSEDPYLLVSNGARGNYVALSHRWGGSQPLMTLRSNISALSEKIEFSHLPKTFQDAVVMTRRLGIRYLWIDSLCIVQDDDEDWAREAQRMATVFGQAYCTIAAASASDSSEGFLSPLDHMKWFKLPYGGESDDDSDNPEWVYAGEVNTDFDHDVEKGLLNTRAWVLQERLMSSRIIHFTSKQIYLECGYGYVCGNLGYSFKPLSLVRSCRFPEPNPGCPRRTRESAFEEIFTKFTSLAITYETDRRYAIAGLEARLAQFYDTESTYGIVHGFLARSLFWNRTTDKQLGRIQYKTDDAIPSWSWMAYHGQVQYASRQSRVSADWEADLRLKPEGNTSEEGSGVLWTRKLEARARGVSGVCSVSKSDNGDCVIGGEGGVPVGWARFDCEDECDVSRLQVICLATVTAEIRELRSWKDIANAWAFEGELPPGSLHCVLLVSGNTPRRVGTGVVHCDYLDPSGVEMVDCC